MLDLQEDSGVSKLVASRKTPKIAGTASPFGSGDLKSPSFPPVAKGLPCRDFVMSGRRHTK